MAVVNISIWVFSVKPSVAETQQQLTFLLSNMQMLSFSHPHKEDSSKQIIENFLQQSIWATLWPYFPWMKIRTMCCLGIIISISTYYYGI